MAANVFSEIVFVSVVAVLFVEALLDFSYLQLQWNAPVVLFAMKMGPAVALGSVVIIKPPEQAPLTPLYLAALAKEVT